MAREVDHAEALLFGLTALLFVFAGVVLAAIAWFAPHTFAGVLSVFVATYVVGMVIQWRVNSR